MPAQRGSPLVGRDADPVGETTRHTEACKALAAAQGKALDGLFIDDDPQTRLLGHAHTVTLDA
jgi:hypothetical protein